MHLLVLHQGAIGDFLLALPVIRAVREYLGAATVTAIASAPTARLAAGRSVVDRWLCPETLGLYRLFCRDLTVDDSLSTTLRESQNVLSFLGGPDHVVHDRLGELTSAEIVSIDPRPSEVTRESRIHITQQWTADIRRAGWSIGDPRPAGIGIERRAKAFVPRVLVHPGSGGQAKCWPLDRWVQLVESLAGADVTWMLGPAEAQQARGLRDRSESVLFELELDRAAEQMATYDLHVGNDGGITHLAAAIRLPTVAVFGTTDPRLWRPLGEHVQVVGPDEPRDGMECVAVDEVLAAVLERLSWLGFAMSR